KWYAASRLCSSASVMLATSPVPSVVRSTVGSWITTQRPSAVACTSSSSMSACHSSCARENAYSVFSGWGPAPPRGAIRRGAPGGNGGGALLTSVVAAGKLESRRCVDRDAVQPVEHEVDQPL